MKNKQILFVAILLVLLLVGWIKAMQTQNEVDILEEQNAILEEADILAEKELYIRAIPLYEKALQYDTEQNDAIEERLMQMYLDFGDVDSYIDLEEHRISENAASEAEYLMLAEIYLDNRALEEGMAVLEKGLAQIGETDQLRAYYEDNRYGYRKYSTNMTEVVPTAGNSMMPVFNGVNWGYINERGQLQLECVYETVTPFNNNGYAVVKQDGKYKVIVDNGIQYGIDELGVQSVAGVNNNYIIAQCNDIYSFYNYDFECIAPAYQYEDITVSGCGYMAVSNDGKWGIITENGTEMCDMIFDAVAVNSLGSVFSLVNGVPVGVAETGGLWYLIYPDGSKVIDIGFADMRAPEGDGLIAVADQNGKWGYIDLTGNVQIPYQYDDAVSFSEGLGAVCVDGSWEYISVFNLSVIKENFTSAYPFRNGIAQVIENGCVLLLHLEYIK